MIKNFDFRTPKGTSIPLQKEVTRIGRAKDNDVIINDPTVSRYHLNIYKKGESIVVECAEGVHEYTLNGAKKSTHSLLSVGDKVQFGRATLYLGFIGEEIPQKSSFKSGSTNSQFDLSQNQSPKKVIDKKLVIRGALLILVVLLIYKTTQDEESPKTTQQKENATQRQVASEDTVINDPSFNSIEESYQKPEPILKGAQDIIAENTFKKGQREYFDKNYVRAIMHFNKALSENPSLEIAKRYLNRAQTRYEKQLETFLSDANTSFRIGHYNRSKSQAAKVLTMLSEQIPGYIYKLSHSNRSPDGRSSDIKIQEDLLVGIPCTQTTQPKICDRALDIVRRSRLELRDEEALK